MSLAAPVCGHPHLTSFQFLLFLCPHWILRRLIVYCMGGASKYWNSWMLVYQIPSPIEYVIIYLTLLKLLILYFFLFQEDNFLSVEIIADI